ncbi:hypothetical protein PSHT_08940 [Puccinia striiformis]|uniref:Uncharacterized protein n=3 Tax=Puccinia striiformis TaxID=27350 RepID=A0A0L0VIK8_9BASI|nr:hypothetical protein PSTG_07606 [Puccinia striiformis f. sp. tritici PST-78]POW01281.1 hypothetical protein PSTT_12603 [Puccinia striiformis]POW09824.1 hypothetical protein PSHT_08940 [Puccinia striiformis]
MTMRQGLVGRRRRLRRAPAASSERSLQKWNEHVIHLATEQGLVIQFYHNETPVARYSRGASSQSRHKGTTLKGSIGED